MKIMNSKVQQSLVYLVKVALAILGMVFLVMSLLRISGSIVFLCLALLCILLSNISNIASYFMVCKCKETNIK